MARDSNDITNLQHTNKFDVSNQSTIAVSTAQDASELDNTHQLGYDAGNHLSTDGSSDHDNAYPDVVDTSNGVDQKINSESFALIVSRFR